MSRNWNGLSCCWRGNRVWRKNGKLKVLRITYICLHFKHDFFHLCHSWHHFFKGFLKRWCYKQWFRGYLCDFNILPIRCIHFITWVFSVILAKESSSRLLLSVLDTDIICRNLKLIPLVLACSTELISKQIWKRSW